jgi:hypothetical protein
LAINQDLTNILINLSAELLIIKGEEIKYTFKSEERVNDKTFIKNDNEMEQLDFKILKSKCKYKKQ